MATKAAKKSRTSLASSKKKTGTKSTKRKSVSKRSATKKSKGTVAATKTSTASATDRYLKDLMTRGEAQELDEHGKLPLEANYAIVGKDKEGKPIVRRARLKAY
jgi:hypothetical protein